MSAVHSCEFEVFGKVQGVYFRRHAVIKATTLGLKGWCMNTADGTVKGYIEGPRTEMRLMKEWLQTTGSPMSNIVKAEFTRVREQRDYGFKNFQIRPDAPKDDSRKLGYKERKTGKWERN